ncbi:MAG: tryptophan 2,3-dioxygenase family protein [Planctomycetota bacterium]|nr:tryptophan 2,3-dioxygenase family protein [Planctomycetota bacterium]
MFAAKSHFKKAAMADLKYGEYLCLEKLLTAQDLRSEESGNPAHDEMLFIITHQAYELWFKQILTEVNSVLEIFQGDVLDDKKIGTVNSRLERIVTIQRVLVHQVDIIETMTPLDFLEFRDLLVPASGFQSLQFKKIEIILGLKKSNRIPADRDFFRTRLESRERVELEDLESQPSLYQLVENWLARIPFLEFKDFDFWKAYQSAVIEMFESEKEIITSNTSLSETEKQFQLGALNQTVLGFEVLLDKEHPDRFEEADLFQMSQRAVLAALFIRLYRDEPILFVPFKLLTNLVEIDELWTTWRQRHAIMVQRMLGTRIGTGGSSGHQYLKKTTESNRFFGDLFNLSSYLIPRSRLPELPGEVRQQLGFYFSAAD